MSQKRQLFDNITGNDGGYCRTERGQCHSSVRPCPDAGLGAAACLLLAS
jgi:hypothetical protein